MQSEIKTVVIPELTKDQLGNRETVREHAKRFEDVVNIAISKLVEREGFNVRTDMGDLEGLSHSLEQNGQQEAGKVDVLEDGTFALVEGHRRYRAWLIVWQRTGNEPYFKATVNSSKTTEAERLFQMFTTQDNEPLKPHEIAELINRLTKLGYSQSDIAKKIGKTPAYISQMLSFASESPVVKEAVIDGHTTVSEVLKLKTRIPSQSQRTEAISNSVAAKLANNSSKTLKVNDMAPGTTDTKRKQKADKIFNAIRQDLDVTYLTEEAWETMYQNIYNNI